MDQNKPEPELFELKLNEAGKAYIRKLAKIATIFFVLVIIINCSKLIWPLKLIIEQHGIEGLSEIKQFQFRVMPWVWICTNIGHIVAIYFTLRFFHGLNTAVKTNNEDQFNRSFRYAVLNGILALCLSTIGFLGDAFFFVADYL
jgi:hypothetical protein